MDSIPGNVLYTPRRVQKCLFGSGRSPTKKNIKKISTRNNSINDCLSEEESDLSELERCHYSTHDDILQQKDILDTRKSISMSQVKNSSIRTPKKLEMNVLTNELMVKTPERHFGKELQNNIKTPHNCETPEQKLITPLTSECKMIPLPKLHKRKSFGSSNTTKSSPLRKENLLKRHASNEFRNTAKLKKTEENSTVPKARAALFQDSNYTKKIKDLILSTHSFYSKSNSETKRNYQNINISLPQNQRRSLPGQLHCNKKPQKRYTIGGVNGGVSHGIRKPKAKASLNTTKDNNNTAMNNIKEIAQNSINVENKISEITETQYTERSVNIERSPTPEIDLNKRFFKIKRSSKRNNSAMVIINKNVKLKVASDGKMSLNQEKLQSVSQAHKRPKLMDISFDTTDLAVDDPELEDSIEKNKVANILKVLENDWVDDDYDTMDILTNKRFGHISPLKPVAILNDVTMSPASELSNMTSIMNIKDISTPLTIKSTSLDNNENNIQEKEPIYYPLFNKGYSSNKVYEDKKSIDNSKNTTNWQLSIKKNGNENQYQLDAGQTHFGATQCTKCGVIYQMGDPEDENAHLNYHNNKKTLKFSGWKTERVIMEDPFSMSRVILVEPNDPKQYWNKIADVLTYVDRDLGLADTQLSDYEQKKVYLYIRDKTILGVLVAEHINTAHRMIPELMELDCCTAESTPVKCGINVLWTEIKHRRQGIASKLVDILRSQFYYGYIMSLDDIAFSIPTLSGKIFAEKYTKTRNFKVYS